MVRHRTRWLLVKAEFINDIRNPTTVPPASKFVSRKNNNNNNNTGPSASTTTRKEDDSSSSSKKDFLALLRKTITLHFGVAAEGVASDVQIRFFDDSSTNLILVRVSRDSCDMVRASMTFLLTRKQLSAVGELDESSSIVDNNSWSDIVASVISVHGSARTAKLATLREIRGLYRQRIHVLRQSHQDKESTKYVKREEKKLCLELQERLLTVQGID
jgi:hypothetical protein